MKSFTTRGVAIVAIATAMGLTAPVAAFADSTTTLPTSTTVVTTTTVVNPWKAWHAAEASYLDKRDAIQQTYLAAVATARATYYTSLASATTTVEDTTARTILDQAIATAIEAESASYVALGNPPPAPTTTKYGAWLDQVQSINGTYRTAVLAAQATYAAALQTSTTSAQRVSAEAALKLAIANAEVARSAALAALGAPPAPTTGPSAYRKAVHAINRTFNQAVDAAKSTYFSEISTTSTKAGRAAVKAAEDLAIANAWVARATALTALGAPPAG
jgi:hypothetical protein